jgi:hypothetical protein
MVLLFLAIWQHLRSFSGGKLHPVGQFAAMTAFGFMVVGGASVLGAAA